MVRFLGKFCERPSKTYTCLIDGWQSLKRKLDDKEITISRIQQISARSLTVSYQQKEPFITETSMVITKIIMSKGHIF